jgi:hypothetical protein
MIAFPEAGKPSQLFDYSLLDITGFQPNVFTEDRDQGRAGEDGP